MINKEDILLKNYTILGKNPLKNAESLKSTIIQLCQENSKLGIGCWLKILQDNIEELESEISRGEYDYHGFGGEFVSQLEFDLLREDFFKNIIEDFVKNKQLLEILYEKSPISNYCSIHYTIAYLIRNHRLQEATIILTYIYKNKKFHNFAKMWQDIISEFYYTNLDHYNGGGLVSDSNYKQDMEIQEFCMAWIERIKDDEEKAGALSHIMRIF